MAMWIGANPVAWVSRYSGGVLQYKYAMLSPSADLGKTIPITTISFPQFESGDNLEVELFQMQGFVIRNSFTFDIINADTDMSLGSPGSILTRSQQILHLLNNILPGKLLDEFRIYIPDWFGDTSTYLTGLLEEIRISQTSTEPVTTKGTIRFIGGRNPLA